MVADPLFVVGCLLLFVGCLLLVGLLLLLSLGGLLWPGRAGDSSGSRELAEAWHGTW